MIRQIALLFPFLLTGCMTAQKTAVTDLPFPQSFATRTAIIHWAEHSTFGGGKWQDVNLHGDRLMITMRTPTSGVPSSDIAVYCQRQHGWELVAGHDTVMNDFIVVDQTPRGLVFRTQSGGEKIMTIP